VRNTSQEEWSDGVVASIEPLQVTVAGWLLSSTDKYYMIRKKMKKTTCYSNMKFKFIEDSDASVFFNIPVHICQ